MRGLVADFKLFQIAGGSAIELAGAPARLETNLQELVEANLEALLGVRFLASEHPAGERCPGRISTLGLDGDNCPVVIEYERPRSGNVINQGLFHLDWIVEHRAEFVARCRQVLGARAPGTIDWGGRRLLCIAGDFTTYDQHAVAQINRNIELIRYRCYGDGYLVLEHVNASSGAPPGWAAASPILAPEAPAAAAAAAAPGAAAVASEKTASEKTASEKTVRDDLQRSPAELRNLYRAFEGFSLSLGNDVTRRALKLYFVFRRAKNFACLEVHPQAQKLVVFVKAEPEEVRLVPGFTRNVRKIDHFGTGDLEITLTNFEDLKRAKPLIAASYAASDGALR